jgi:hypothetical protein
MGLIYCIGDREVIDSQTTAQEDVDLPPQGANQHSLPRLDVIDVDDLLPDLQELSADRLVADLEGTGRNLVAVSDVAILVDGLFRQEYEHLNLEILVDLDMAEARQHQSPNSLELRSIVDSLHDDNQLIQP